jgi:hypothetical protein
MSFKYCWIGCQHVSFFIAVCYIVVSTSVRLIIVFENSMGGRLAHTSSYCLSFLL